MEWYIIKKMIMIDLVINWRLVVSRLRIYSQFVMSQKGRSIMNKIINRIINEIMVIMVKINYNNKIMKYVYQRHIQWHKYHKKHRSSKDSNNNLNKIS